MKRLLTILAALCCVPAIAMSQEHRIEISLETAPNHIRNLVVSDFAEALEEAADGRLEVEIFHAASKYSGSSVPTALAQSALDMGFPGTWHMGSILAEFNLPGLPLFYGRTRAEQYTVWDGAVGQEMAHRLEEKLGVKVIGRWMDLGYGQMFFTKKNVTSHEDLVGLKMRAPGGAANIARYDGFGAAAVAIGWGDVPQALQRGTVDGLLTTHEAARSAKLWDSGLKYAYDDNQTFFQYVPVMSTGAWSELPEDLQKIVVDTWEASVDAFRLKAEEAQNEARTVNEENGIAIVTAGSEDILTMRAKLLEGQDALIGDLGIDSEIVAQAAAILESE
ncbi:TRAP transporter substrate-binding protein DctP [Roseovarius sp.]|uniref:TRAP transporter substrate-binding protein DctP n=1 Tax=Roseovarius sp. TaxID=1486281 RepID=UPI003A97B057